MKNRITLDTIIDEENAAHVNAALLLLEFIESHWKVQNLETTMEDSLFFKMCSETTFKEFLEEAVNTAIKLKTQT
jgi:hypothetical protein